MTDAKTVSVRVMLVTSMLPGGPIEYISFRGYFPEHEVGYDWTLWEQAVETFRDFGLDIEDLDYMEVSRIDRQSEDMIFYFAFFADYNSLIGFLEQTDEKELELVIGSEHLKLPDDQMALLRLEELVRRKNRT